MFTISSNGIITVNRGDTFSISLSIDSGYGPYVLRSADKVYFGLCEPNQPWEEAIVKKVLDYRDQETESSTKDITIKFYSEDTEHLVPGKYYYSIKLHKVNLDDSSTNEVDTVISKTIFYIV